MKKFYILFTSIAIPFFLIAQQFAAYNKAVTRVPGSPSIRENYTVNRIAVADVSNNLGKQVTMCGKVFAAKQQKDQAGPLSIFTVGGEYVNERVDLRIRVEEGYNFPADLYQTIASKNLCFTGFVLDEDGAPLLFIDSTSLKRMITQASQASPEKFSEPLQEQPLKVLANAYLLQGPRWKDPVITHLKTGSIIVAEQIRGAWALVRVVEKNGENVEAEEITGFITTKALGLGRNGTVEP